MTQPGAPNVFAAFELAERLPYMTVRINTRATTEGPWTGVGTGFIWEEPADKGTAILLITNRHVAQGAAVVGIRFHRGGRDAPIEGPGIEVEFSNPAVWYHPDPTVDLAAISLAQIWRVLKERGDEPYFRGVTRRNVPTPDQVRELSAMEEVIVVGYPNGVYDVANNLPVSRRGVTAVAPWVDYQGSTDLLLDMAVFGGSSGSPVFVLQSSNFRTKEALVMGGLRFYFLGVLKAYHSLTATGEIVQEEIPAALRPVAKTRQPINLAVCVKASRVVELVDHTLAAWRDQARD